MHSWSHVCTHERTLTHVHTEQKKKKRKPLEGIVFPHSLSHTHSSSRFSSWHPPFSSKPRIWHGSGVASQLRTHNQPRATRHMENKIKQHFKRLTDEDYQRRTRYLFHLLSSEFSICWCKNISFHNYFSLHLLRHHQGKGKEPFSRNKISHPLLLQSYSGVYLAQLNGYFGVLCTVVWWAITGVCFSTNISLCDGLSGVRRSKCYNPLLRVSVDGKVRKISPCFSLLIW